MRYRNLLVLLLVAWLYAPLFAHLFPLWMHDPFFSHGIFVPVFALLVLWRERSSLKAIEASPSLGGLPLVGLAIFMWASAGLKGNLFLSGISLLLLLAGLIILGYGWDFFRAVLFPWVILVLMIPIPSAVLQKVPFSLPSVKLAAFLLQLAGVPLLREGNLIVLQGGSIFAFEAATGIRSLLTPLTVAVMHAFLTDKRTWVRAVLVCSSVPIAIVAQSLRIVGTCLLAQFWSVDDAAAFYPFWGWMTFAISLIGLFVLHRLILRIWRGRTEAKHSMQLPATSTSTLRSQ